MRHFAICIFLLIGTTVLVAGSAGSALAADPPEGAKKSPQMCAFVDEDGDGFNDLAPDRDGDGIPDRLDPDTSGLEDSQNRVRHWYRFARLFDLLREAQIRQGAGNEPARFGLEGLGDGPGPRTGSRPGSDGSSGDGAGQGGGTPRREGQR